MNTDCFVAVTEHQLERIGSDSLPPRKLCHPLPSIKAWLGTTDERTSLGSRRQRNPDGEETRRGIANWITVVEAVALDLRRAGQTFARPLLVLH